MRLAGQWRSSFPAVRGGSMLAASARSRSHSRSGLGAANCLGVARRLGGVPCQAAIPMTHASAPCRNRTASNGWVCGLGLPSATRGTSPARQMQHANRTGSRQKVGSSGELIRRQDATLPIRVDIAALAREKQSTHHMPGQGLDSTQLRQDQSQMINEPSRLAVWARHAPEQTTSSADRSTLYAASSAASCTSPALRSGRTRNRRGAYSRARSRGAISTRAATNRSHRVNPLGGSSADAAALPSDAAPSAPKRFVKA